MFAEFRVPWIPFPLGKQQESEAEAGCSWAESLSEPGLTPVAPGDAAPSPP